MLTPEQARDRAADIVARARAAGADAADAVFAADAALEVSVRLGALEDVGRSESEDLGLRVFVGRRSASVSTSDLSGDAMDRAVERAVAMAREAPEDRWAGLAPEERLLRGAPPMLDLDDGGEVAPEALRAAALEAEEAARAVAGVTNSEGAGASASRVVSALATSHGFAAGYAATGYGLSVSVVAGEGANMQRDYAHHGARLRRLLESPEAIGMRAGERTVARLNPAKLASGAMPVVYDPRVGSSLVGHLVSAIAGAAITRRTSFLLDRLGERVMAAGIRIEDDPHRPHGLRSRPFDGEGLAVSPTAIVEDGVLETWLLDSASARQLGLEPTGHAARGTGGGPGVSTSNLFMAAGRVPVDTLIADIADGVYVTELIGSGVNPVTGDYSRGAADFVFIPGDNANHGTPEQYARMMEALAPLSLLWRIIPGDHDFEPGDLSNYEAAIPRTNRPETEVIAGHRCLFLDVVSAGAGGPDFRLTMHHRNRLAEELARAKAEGQVPLVFMHAYPGDLAADGDAIARQFIDGEVAFVDTGHTHYNELLNDGRVLYGATRSTAQIEEDGGAPGFTIVCVQDRVVSWRFRRLDAPWPHVQIVSPGDVRLITRPTDPHHVPRPGAVEVVARLFGADMPPVARVGDTETPMTRGKDGLWRATVTLAAGLNAIEVRCGEGYDRIDCLVRDGHSIPKRRLPVAPGEDCHAIGAWPIAGIDGARLGPNKNGCGW